MDAEKYEEAVRDYEKITKMDHNHGKSQFSFLSLYFKMFTLENLSDISFATIY